jgi:hypothetical protein
MGSLESSVYCAGRKGLSEEELDQTSRGRGYACSEPVVDYKRNVNFHQRVYGNLKVS